MPTPQQAAAEAIGRAIDGRIFRLQSELDTLDQTAVAARRSEIAAEMAELQIEKARIDPRRPPAPVITTPAAPATPNPVADDLPGRVR